MTGWHHEDWVLVLDDDPWALEIYRSMLDHHGIPVHTTQSEKAAHAAIQRLGAPTVMLLDVMMPGSSGFDVCRRLRAAGSLRHTRVVFATALDDEESRLAALNAGADDLITKPVSESLLITRIRSLIELSQLRDRNDARAEYETVLNTLGEGVITLDATDHIVTANAPAIRLLGLPQSFGEPVHLPSFIEQHWTVAVGAIARSSKARLVWDSGRPGIAAALDWTSRELPPSADTHAAWTVVIRDVTDTWAQDRAVDRLIRSLGHKLRIPLTGVTTSLELIQENQDLDAGTRDLLEIAATSAERLQDALLRILQFTEAVASSGTAETIPLAPDRIRDQLNIDPAVEVIVDLPSPVEISLGVVQRGIDELTRNAGLAGAHTIVLEVASNPDGSVLFSVTDDGGGVPHGIAHRIFEPFYQLDQTGEAVGTGLGLAILAAEVRALGGTLGVSTPERGRTTVWFQIPAAGSMPPNAAPYPGTASPGRHRPAAREIDDCGGRAPLRTSGRAPASGFVA